MAENNSSVPVLDDAVFDMTNSENLHAEVSEILNKNVITDDDVERYRMNKDSSVSVGEFCNLLNSLLSEDSDLESHLSNFGCEAMNLIKPCLYNQKAFDVVDMTSEVQYWIDVYKDRYSDEQLVRECCQSIVFNLFCIIDGVSSNNDFKIEKTVFDDTMQDAEFHRLWCEYLNKKQQGE